MAAYPSHSILLESSITPESGIVDDYAQSGPQHSRIFHSQTYYVFNVVHALTLAEYNTQKATYDAAPRDPYTLSWFDESPAVTYTVKYTGPPTIRQKAAADKYLIDVPLRGTKD